jgi:hypothetical protein
MPTKQWTPAEREAASARLLAARAARKTDAPAPSPVPTSPAVPPADIVELPAHMRTPKPSRAKAAAPSQHDSVTGVATAPPPAFTAADLVSSLNAIPLERLTYDDCGALINALSAATTAVALTRRQRQEQMDAGSPQARCYNPTCGRKIDITKSGGFQILTERDEFHQPINRYYCSQNCLLARGMPSHARSTPKVKTGATA